MCATCQPNGIPVAGDTYCESASDLVQSTCKTMYTGPNSVCHIMYLMADNDLESALAKNSENVFISPLVQCEDPAYMPKVYFDGNKLKGSFYITAKNGRHNFVRNLTEQNSDSPATVTSFMTWALQSCMDDIKNNTLQLENMAIVIGFGSHASGWTFGGDSSSGKSYINNAQIRMAIGNALANTVNKGCANPKQVDMLYYDACLQGSLYGVTDLALDTLTCSVGPKVKLAKWLLASQAMAPGLGLDHFRLFKDLWKNNGFSMENIGKSMVTINGNSMRYYPQAPASKEAIMLPPPVTWSLIDMNNGFPVFNTVWNNFIEYMTTAINTKSDSTLSTILIYTRSQSKRFAGYMGNNPPKDSGFVYPQVNVDVGSFLDTLLARCNPVSDFRSLINQVQLGYNQNPTKLIASFREGGA